MLASRSTPTSTTRRSRSRVSARSRASSKAGRPRRSAARARSAAVTPRGFWSSKANRPEADVLVTRPEAARSSLPRSKRGESDALPGLRRGAPGAGAAASASAAPPTLAGRASRRWGLRGGGGRPIGVMGRLVAAPLGPTAPVVAGASVAEPAAPRLEPRAALLREPASLLGGRLDLGHEEVVVRPLHRDLLADELLDRFEVKGARLIHEADRLAARARARRAPDAMHVVFGVLGQVPVDDVAHRLDVEPARGDVGRHEHRQAALLEVLQDLEAPLLVHVAGERTRLVAIARQPVLEPSRLLARVREDQDPVTALPLEEPEEHREL